MEIGEAKQFLLDKILEGITVTGLLEACAGLLGSPLRFTFHGGRNGFLVSEGYPYADVLQSQLALTEAGTSLEEAYQAAIDRGAKEHGTEPFLQPPPNPGMARRLQCAAADGSRWIGLLTLPECRVPLERIDRPLMALCARCLAMRLRQAFREERNTNYREGMYRLIHAMVSSYSDMAGVVGPGMPPRTGHYRLLMLACPEDGDKALSALCEQTARLTSTEWYISLPREGAVLLSLGRIPEALREEFVEMLSMSGCRACVSPVYRDLMDTPLWRRRINRLPAYVNAGPGALVVYRDWLDWGLFGEAALSPEQVEAFIPKEIMAMRDWDRDHGTLYLPTLAAFIRHYGRRKQAAAAMKTHVNTVNYRLQKMEELFGLDLHAPETPYRAFFAVRLMEYLDAARVTNAE